MGTLQLGSSSFVKLIDVADNFAGGEPEALYVNSVIILLQIDY